MILTQQQVDGLRQRHDIVSSMACGFFAGLFVSGPWSIALAGIVVAMEDDA